MSNAKQTFLTASNINVSHAKLNLTRGLGKTRPLSTLHWLCAWRSLKGLQTISDSRTHRENPPLEVMSQVLRDLYSKTYRTCTMFLSCSWHGCCSAQPRIGLQTLPICSERETSISTARRNKFSGPRTLKIAPGMFWAIVGATRLHRLRLLGTMSQRSDSRRNVETFEDNHRYERPSYVEKGSHEY